MRRHALGGNVPCRDLYITRGHVLYLEGVLIPVEELINHRSIAWVEEARVVKYYHLGLDRHDVIFAEHSAAESFREDANAPLFHNAVRRRRIVSAFPGHGGFLSLVDMIATSVIRDRFVADVPLSNERGLASFSAAYSRSLGYGGIAAVARAAGIDPSTIGRGLAELAGIPDGP